MSKINRRQMLTLGVSATAALVLPKVAKAKQLPSGLVELPEKKHEFVIDAKVGNITVKKKPKEDYEKSKPGNPYFVDHYWIYEDGKEIGEFSHCYVQYTGERACGYIEIKGAQYPAGFHIRFFRKGRKLELAEQNLQKEGLLRYNSFTEAKVIAEIEKTTRLARWSQAYKKAQRDITKILNQRTKHTRKTDRLCLCKITVSYQE